MWLTVAAPSIESWSMWLKYSEEVQEINETDYTVDIETPDDINTLVAKQKGLTLEQYKNELGEKIREQEIEKLNEKYGIESDDDDEDEGSTREEVLKKYDDLAKRLDNSDKVRQMYAANKLFEKPDTGEEK